MPDEFREHLTRDQRPFLHPESLQILQIHKHHNYLNNLNCDTCKQNYNVYKLDSLAPKLPLVSCAYCRLLNLFTCFQKNETHLLEVALQMIFRLVDKRVLFYCAVTFVHLSLTCLCVTFMGENCQCNKSK